MSNAKAPWLDTDELQHAIATLFGEPLASFGVSIRPLAQGHYGAEGDKLLADCCYRTRNGCLGEICVFCKRFHRPGPSEAPLYEHLQRLRVPLPRLLGHFRDGQDHEVLLLEHLDKVYQDSDLLTEPRQCADFVRLIARFNAAGTLADLAEGLNRIDIGTFVTKDLGVLTDLHRQAGSGTIGDELQGLLTDHSLLRLRKTAMEIADATSRMPLGLIHGDLFPRHVGHRCGSSDLLVFDLAHTGLGARFFDIATYVNPNDEFRSSLSAEELAVIYLQAYLDAGCESISVEAFLHEARTLWMAWNYRCLRWWMPRAEEGQDGSSAARNSIIRLLEAMMKYETHAW